MSCGGKEEMTALLVSRREGRAVNVYTGAIVVKENQDNSLD